MGLLSRYLKQEVPTLNKNNIRLQYIGRQQELPEAVQERMEWAREATSHNTRNDSDAGPELQRSNRTGRCLQGHGRRRAPGTAALSICESTKKQYPGTSTPDTCPIRIW